MGSKINMSQYVEVSSLSDLVLKLKAANVKVLKFNGIEIEVPFGKLTLSFGVVKKNGKPWLKSEYNIEVKNRES